MRNIAVDLLYSYREKIIALQKQCITDVRKKMKLNTTIDESKLGMIDEKTIDIPKLKDKFANDTTYLIDFQRDLAGQLTQNGTKNGILIQLKYYGEKVNPLRKLGLDLDKEFMTRLTNAMLPGERPKLSKIHACVAVLNQYLDAREDLEREYDILVRKITPKETTSIISGRTATASTTTRVPALPSVPAPRRPVATASSSSTSANDAQFSDLASASNSASASATNSPRTVDTPRSAFTSASESPRSALSEDTDTVAPAAAKESASSQATSTPAKATTQTWIFGEKHTAKKKAKASAASTTTEPAASHEKKGDTETPQVKK